MAGELLPESLLPLVLETRGVALEGEADGLMDNPQLRKAHFEI